jgi:hypothetical protein
MPLLRAWRPVLVALWSACKSIDLEDCTLVVGYALLGYGCALIQPAYGYIVPGALLVLPRVLVTVMRGRPAREVEERRRWAS